MRRLLAAGLVLMLGGCGGEKGVGEVASTRLTPQVQQLREAVARGDRTAAGERLAELRQSVAELRTQGDLDQAGADGVLAAAAAVEAELPPAPATATATSAATAPSEAETDEPEPTPTTAADDEDKGRSRGKGKDKEDED